MLFFAGFIEHSSGWILLEIIELRVKCIDTLFFSGGCKGHMLPKFVKDKKACLAIVCTDDRCFLYAILAGIYPVYENAGKIRH